MKKLFHLSTTPKQLRMFEGDWEEIKQFVGKNQMDGIELGLTLDYDIEQIPKEIIEGVHLSFYPMWVDFWRQDEEKLSQLFATKEERNAYYQGDSPECLVTSYRKQYERAKALGAKYMVFHVSHVLPEDSFTWEFTYSDKEVMIATLELINSAFPKEENGPLLLFENLWWPGLNYKDSELTKWFIEQVEYPNKGYLVNSAFPKEENGPLLLFENLWWPGLNYKDSELTKWFIEQVEYPNKGYLVDISHLILNNKEIGTEQEAYFYIKQIIKSLGETKQWIKAVHLNKTLPKRYMQRDHSYLLKKYREIKDSKQKLTLLKKHIQALDGHIPFDHPIAKKIVALINPEYCVYETAPKSRYELAYFIKKQNEAMK